jgi:hypothetical protein
MLLLTPAMTGMWMRKQAMARKPLQNVRVLPKDPKNLEIFLGEFDARGFIDIEVVWKLRQKEGLSNVRRRFVGRFSRMSLLTASQSLCSAF